ncbi:MAG: DUF3108 domain-containing protein [Luteimonas sp.]
MTVKNTLFQGRLLRIVAAATLVLASLPALAIKPFTANYQASFMGMEASGQMTLAPAGADRWKYTLSIKNSLAQMTQITTFEDRNGQWRPLSGSDSTNLLIKKSNKDASYDWAKGEARWSGDVKPDRAGPLKLQAGDLDALLVNLALARDVPAGKALSYRMVEDGRAKQLNYRVAGKETITVGGKEQQATKVSRTDGNKETIAWVVDGLPVPARILQRKNGKDEIDLRIKSVR